MIFFKSSRLERGCKNFETESKLKSPTQRVTQPLRMLLRLGNLNVKRTFLQDFLVSIPAFFCQDILQIYRFKWWKLLTFLTIICNCFKVNRLWNYPQYHLACMIIYSSLIPWLQRYEEYFGAALIVYSFPIPLSDNHSIHKLPFEIHYDHHHRHHGDKISVDKKDNTLSQM